MGNVSYRPLIEDMTWSYSRLETWESCPYKWYRKYICEDKEEAMFYASLGSFVHKIIELYYIGIISKKEMPKVFLLDYQKQVQGKIPSSTIAKSRVEDILEYLKNFRPFPYKVIGIEKEFKFSIGDFKFIGFIDFLGEKDGEIYIVDNKSRNLKPRSKRGKPTQNDLLLDKMLRQLYLYSAAVEQNCGKLPSYLCFNCFRSGDFIKEPFDTEKYEETKEWAVSIINEILDAENFIGKPDFFSCNNICGFHNKCQYL